ncbi:hypothetical protein C8Q70DRAFT_1024914 [Cubamyces menziesii]|nr:hypothetical protein C8Q70DRAFT_1024914 [Cubamyces menziesii]
MALSIPTGSPTYWITWGACATLNVPCESASAGAYPAIVLGMPCLPFKSWCACIYALTCHCTRAYMRLPRCMCAYMRLLVVVCVHV